MEAASFAAHFGRERDMEITETNIMVEVLEHPPPSATYGIFRAGWLGSSRSQMSSS